MLLFRIPGLLFKPEKTWHDIRQTNASVLGVYFGFFLLLAAIPPVCAYVGTTMVGWSVGDGPVIKLNPDSALRIAIVFYLAILIAVYAIGRMIHWMGDTYGFTRSAARCIQLAAFAISPMLLIGVFLLFSELWLIYLLGLPVLIYCVYLLYTGVPIMLDIPKEKGFLLSSAVLAVGLVSIVGLLVATVFLWGMGIGPSFNN